MSKINSIEKVKELFNSYGLTLLNKEFISSRERMECIDSEGYKYLVCENQLQSGKMPEKYSIFNPYTMENVQRMLDLESKGSVVKNKIYEGSRMLLTITCEDCGKEITKTWAQIMNRKKFKCPCCNVSPIKYDLNYVKKCFKGKGYKIIEETYKGNNIPILCKDSDGYKVKISYSNLIGANKVPNRFSPIFNKENLIYNINHYFILNQIDCKAVKYVDKTINNTMCIMCQCECGNIFETNWNSIKEGKVRCDYCTKTMSNLEYTVRKWLDDNNIVYEFQKRFFDCKDERALPFDFYIPKFNCCIEVDGQQHYRPAMFSAECDALAEFKKRKKHDAIKTKYCEKNNIDLLRISYKDIKQVNKKYIEKLSNKFIKD